MLTFDPPLTPEERAALRAFRRTAQAVHRILGPLAPQSITVDLRGSSEHGEQNETRSWPEDVVRSLAIAVRQPELKKEPGNFERVIEILERAREKAVREFCAAVRDQWRFALVSPPGLVMDGHSYSGEDVFKTWLYARAVHQDSDRQEHAERLAASGPLPAWIVQVVIRHRAIAILSLDTGVAEALGEEPLGEDSEMDGVRSFRF